MGLCSLSFNNIIFIVSLSNLSIPHKIYKIHQIIKYKILFDIYIKITNFNCHFKNHENKKISTIKIKTAIKQKILTPLIFHKTNKKTIKHLKKILLNYQPQKTLKQ